MKIFKTQLDLNISALEDAIGFQKYQEKELKLSKKPIARKLLESCKNTITDYNQCLDLLCKSCTAPVILPA